MASREEVKAFLHLFKTKMSIWDVLYYDRKKNTQALLDLEIRPIDREEILKKLEISNYSEGPFLEKMLKGADIWVFGKEVKNKEVYIKITLGILGANVICISFHIAEHPMNYPFK